MLTCSGCGTHEKVKEPTVSWRSDTTGKYLKNEAVKSLIAVRCTQGHEASIVMFEKSEVGAKTVWTQTLECDAYIGEKGLGKTKEGDMKTPKGDFGIIEAFGIKPNPGTKLPYIDVTDSTYCCGCPDKYYNKIIDMNDDVHDCPEGEHLIDYSPEYNYGFFLDYNKECEPGKGSAIFFHCKGANTYTAGCIAVSEEDMVKMLRAIDSNTRVIIDYMPK